MLAITIRLLERVVFKNNVTCLVRHIKTIFKIDFFENRPFQKDVTSEPFMGFQGTFECSFIL